MEHSQQGDPSKNNATLYFHFPCFDGLVSAVLTWEFLLRKYAGAHEIVPVNYKTRDVWLSRPLRIPCAVVDFLYHPDADFWADHHQSTFLNPEVKADFEHRKRSHRLLFDPQANSCASLLFCDLQEFLTRRQHFTEMVAWAEKIDSAAYSSAEEAILGDAPALQINRTLMLESGTEYARFLLQRLLSHDLSQVASLPEIESKDKEVRKRILAGLKQVERRLKLEEGEIATFDGTSTEHEIISRYAPYHFAPNSRYSIAVVHSPDGATITAMRNPWRRFESIPLGSIFEKFGGGGHQRVGAVFIPKERSLQVQDVVDSVLSSMRQPANEATTV